MIITDEYHDGLDDIWTNWFKCPKCEDTLIMLGASYCCSCGKKIKWDLKETYQ